jgi:abequosyltransferase
MTATTPTTASPLLTIIVPTYNRADNLALLLETLRVELAGLQEDVTVLVSDNASTDATPEVVAAARAAHPALLAQRHERNLGPDGNFCACVEHVSTRYFWIIGDDDLPKRGVIAKVVQLLRRTSPALVYLQSEWVNPIVGSEQGEPVGTLEAGVMDAEAFARRVNVWFTFISGVVVDRSLLVQELGPQSIRRFTGTSLVQLGWILPLLSHHHRFVFVSNRCVLATKDNTGGYPLMTVFGVRFARIVNDVFGRDSHFARLLIGGNILHYLPGLIWGARTAPSGRHDQEDVWPAMRAELGHRPLFWLLLMPLGRFPLWLAQPFYQTWRVFHRLHRDWARLRGVKSLKGAA